MKTPKALFWGAALVSPLFSSFSAVSMASSSRLLGTAAADCLWAHEETGIDWAHQTIGRPGEGVLIAQLDTGYLPSPYFEIGMDVPYGLDLARPRLGSVLPVLNWVETGKEPLDFPVSANQVSLWGHGVSIAGVLLNQTSRGALFDGVVPYARVIPYRISPYILSGSPTGAPAFSPTENVARALRNAITQGVDVVNLSFAAVVDTNGPQLTSPSGGGLGVTWNVAGASGELTSAFEAAEKAGIIVVVAAGQNVPFNLLSASAANSHVFAIAGSERGEKAWASSVSGNNIVASAPAKDICYARPAATNWPGPLDSAALDAISKSFVWEKSEGTSYSAAFVSGIAALWIQANPGLPKAERAKAFRTALKTHGTVTPAGWPASGYGKGIVNIRSLLEGQGR
ncbi:MAG: S8 family serine peptidase [Silvanigrellales bacterium]|nr:S8 family serine peptidase [Silvanigrellales bacterium]